MGEREREELIWEDLANIKARVHLSSLIIKVVALAIVLFPVARAQQRSTDTNAIMSNLGIATIGSKNKTYVDRTLPQALEM